MDIPDSQVDGVKTSYAELGYETVAEDGEPHRRPQAVPRHRADHDRLTPTQDGRAAVDPPELSGDLGEVDAAGLASGAEVEDALVTGELLGASVDDLTISGCRFDRVRLTGSSLDGVALEDVLFADCELSGVTMGGAKLERVRFEHCRMSGLSAADLHAEHVGFEDCRLDDAWFRMSDIERAEFLDCDLRKADFYATTVRRTAFIGCDLTGAELSKAVVAEVRLERSTIIDVGGIGDLRDIVLSPELVTSFAIPFLASFGITVDFGDE